MKVIRCDGCGRPTDVGKGPKKYCEVCSNEKNLLWRNNWKKTTPEYQYNPKWAKHWVWAHRIQWNQYQRDYKRRQAMKGPKLSARNRMLHSLELSHILYPSNMVFTAENMDWRLSLVESLVSNIRLVIKTKIDIENNQKSAVLELVNKIHQTPLAKIPYIDGKIEGTIEIYEPPVGGEIKTAKKIEMTNGRINNIIANTEQYLGGTNGTSEQRLTSLERVSNEDLERVVTSTKRETPSQQGHIEGGNTSILQCGKGGGWSNDYPNKSVGAAD